MAYNIGRIMAPVSIYDVQQALGSGSPDLGTLCRSANINKWSKYKPIYSNLVDTVTGQWDPSAQGDLVNDKWKNTADWFKGTNSGLGTTLQIYGWTPYQGTDLATVLAQYGASGGTENGWVYHPVVGGANSVYRLQDFAGYNHNAYQPQSKMSCPDNIRTSVSGVTFGPTVLQRTTDGYTLRNRNYILPKDVLMNIIGASQWDAVYQGFAILDRDTINNQNTVIVYTTDNYITIKNSDVSTYMTLNKVYKVCLFFTDRQAQGANWTNGGAGKFATLPYMEVVDFQVSGQDGISGLTTSLTAVIYNDRMRVHYTFVNNNTNNYTMHIHVIVNGVDQGNIYDVQVNSGSTVDDSYYRFIMAAKPRTVKVALYANTTFVREIVAMDTDYDPGFDPINPE